MTRERTGPAATLTRRLIVLAADFEISRPY